VKTSGTEGKPAATAELLAIAEMLATAGTQSTADAQATAMTSAKLVTPTGDAKTSSNAVHDTPCVFSWKFAKNSSEWRKIREKIIRKRVKNALLVRSISVSPIAIGLSGKSNVASSPIVEVH